MQKIMEFLENKVMPIAGKMAAQRHLSAVRDGMILTMPLIIIGSLFLILANFPVQSYLDYMNAHPTLKTSLLYPYRGSFELVALVATVGVAYRLAESYKTDPLASGVIALAAYFVVTPITTFTVGDATVTAMETAFFTSKGLFVGLLIALLTTEIYRKIVQKNIIIRLPDGVPPSVAKSFAALIPGFFAILVVWGIRLLVENVGSFGSVHNVVITLLQEPLTKVGTSYIGVLVIFLIIGFLWMAGLHGASIVGAVTTPIWLQMTNENALAVQNNEVVQHIITNEFKPLIFIGGSGTTLGLVIAMLLFARSQQMKQLGKLSIGPGLFQINEPVLFGMPIVLNPMMLIPFLLAPLTCITIAYFSMDLGIVAKPIGVVPPWTTPPIIQGYLITGSISGAILQIVLFIVSFFIYFPFFKMWDNQKLEEERRAQG